MLRGIERSPFLSLITPYNGSSTFVYFLQSLNKQTLNQQLFEVIVVQEDTCDAEKLVSTISLQAQVTVATCGLARNYNKHSAAILRNYGARKAKGKVLVFIDSDCILTPDCLSKHYDFHMQYAGFVLCGSTSELPIRYQSKQNIGLLLQNAPKMHKFLVTDYRVKFESLNRQISWLELYTSNTSFSLEAFNIAGGFDESGFRCHDIDISYRLFKSGSKYQYDSLCSVIHLEHPRSITYRMDQIDGWKWMAAKHPEISELVKSKVILFKKAFDHVNNRCKDIFASICEYLQDAIIADHTIVMEQPNDSVRLQKILSTYPHFATEDKYCIRYQLRLHRDCWNYHIVLLSGKIEEPFFSVLIPFRNRLPELGRALRSVFQQSYQSFEVILINDYSSDTGFEELLPLLRSNRIKVINNQKHLGQSNSLNIGLLNSVGKYIFQLDSDDWLSESALAEVEKNIREKSALALYGNPFIVEGENIRFEEGFQIKDPIDCFSYSTIQAPRVYSKTLLEKTGGWPVNDSYAGYFYEDRLLLKTMASACQPFFFKKPVYYVSVHKTSLSRSNVLNTASAKLSILFNEVNKEQKLLKYRLEGRGLRTWLSEREYKEIKNTFSVILIFKREISHLQLALKSWIEAIAFSDLKNVEILIINDSLDQNIDDLGKASKSIKVLNSSGNRGPSSARNLGAAASKNEIIFFGDEDHIVPKDIFFFHDQHHSNNVNAIVTSSVFGRRVIMDLPSEIRQNTKESILTNYWFRPEFEKIAYNFALSKDDQLTVPDADIYKGCFQYSYTEQWLKEWAALLLIHGVNLRNYDNAWLKCCSGNLSVRKKTFYEIGTFDERLKSMEDWELGIRAMINCKEIILEPHAEPFHILHNLDNSRDQYDKAALEFIKETYPLQVDRLIRSTYHSSLREKIKKGPGDNVLLHKKPATKNPNIISITFDDGPHDFFTNFVLDWLGENRLKATFFTLGMQAQAHPDLIRRIVSEGHELGLHNWMHKKLSVNNYDEIFDSILQTGDIVEQIASTEVRLVRPPYGVVSQRLVQELNAIGYRLIGWSGTSKDWSTGITDKQIITSLASTGITNRILLFHDGVGEPKSLKKALNWLNTICDKNQIAPVTVSEYLRLNNLSQFTVGFNYI